jgi:phosphoserine phosphatase RsbU/P
LKGVTGLQYEGFFRPAESVGGDYYDFLELPDGYFSLTLGDVSGKGLPAAVLMASIQMLLRSHLLRQALPLSKLVQEVSNTLYRCSSNDRYSTLFCAVLDAERRTLTYVNAGHPSPLLVRASGAIQRLESTSIPIGMLPIAQYREETIDVKPGDLILCTSDGVTEATNRDGEMLEQTGVEETVLACKDKSVANVVATLVKRTDLHSLGMDQHDDITIIAVRIS